VANEGGVDEGGDWVSHERERAGHRDLHDLLPELVPSEGEPEDGRSARGDEKQVEIKQQAIAGAPATGMAMDHGWAAHLASRRNTLSGWWRSPPLSMASALRSRRRRLSLSPCIVHTQLHKQVEGNEIGKGIGSGIPDGCPRGWVDATGEGNM